MLIDSEPYFVAKDVAEILGYSETNALTKRLDSDEFISDKLEGMNMKSVLLNESGLYNAIFGSKLENAKKFRKWVFSEVLRSIRKHGAYITDELLQDNDRLNNVIAELQMENELKESRIEELEEVRTEYMKQRDKIIRIQIKCGNTKGNGRFIPYCILQLVREFIKDSENVEYRDDEIIKVNSRKLIRFVKGLFPKKYDAQSYLSQCLDINAWENVTVIPTNILEDEYEPLQDILY